MVEKSSWFSKCIWNGHCKSNSIFTLFDGIRKLLKINQWTIKQWANKVFSTLHFSCNLSSYNAYFGLSRQEKKTYYVIQTFLQSKTPLQKEVKGKIIERLWIKWSWSLSGNKNAIKILQMGCIILCRQSDQIEWMQTIWQTLTLTTIIIFRDCKFFRFCRLFSGCLFVCRWLASPSYSHIRM